MWGGAERIEDGALYHQAKKADHERRVRQRLGFGHHRDPVTAENRDRERAKKPIVSRTGSERKSRS
jgi:hypothetical protein